MSLSIERVNSISDDKFDELVCDGNSHLYEILIDALEMDNADFEVVSIENGILKISFAEKGNDSTSMISVKENMNGLDVSRRAKE